MATAAPPANCARSARAPARLARASARLARAWARLARGDRFALASFVALPILLYAPWFIAGHPLLPGDELVQNYPLRVLAGTLIRSGHLPSWDSMIWSGTPLLAGWNGGSMFPGTWLFAVLPALFAWLVNFIAVPVLCATGVYVLARRLSCQPLAASLGALVFTYTGFMSGQTVHIGLVQGSALTPWMLVAVDGIARNDRAERRVGYAVLLGVAFGLDVLAWDPRSVTSGVIATAIFALAYALRSRAHALRLLSTTLGGGVLGLALSALQWLPGLGFLRSSQRGSTAYSFFGAGSLSVPHLGSLLVAPFLLGGNGNFGMPVYAGSYNLPELTVGVGFAALVATFAYLPELGRSFLSWLRKDPDPPGRRRPLGVHYALVVVGVALSLGSNSPLGRLLVHIPLYGGERLQNRNAVLFDLGFALLLALFVDDLTARTDTRATARILPLVTRTSRMLAILPALCTGALVAFAYLAPLNLEFDLHVLSENANLFQALDGYIVPTLALALLGACFALVAWRLPARARRHVLAALCLADVGTYLVFASWASVPSSLVGSSTTLSRQVARTIGATGRFALYNPAFQAPGGDSRVVEQLGVTDMNILQHNRSVQGYGSIVQGVYQNVTATHQFENLDVTRLGGESFNTLDLAALVTLPIYFQEAIPSHSAIPIPGAPAVTATGLPGPTSDAPSPAPFAAGPWSLAPGGRAQWLLATPQHVVRVTVAFLPRLGGYPTSLDIAAIAPGEAPRFARAPVANGQVHYTFPAPVLANEIVVRLPAGAPSTLVGAVVAVTANPDVRLLLDGALQGAISPPHWVYGGTIGPFVLERNTETRGFAWLQPPRLKTPETAALAPGRVTVLPGAPAGSQTMIVRSPGVAVLVRSETYARGWTARLQPLGGGPTKVITAHRFGLVQAIDIPPGSWRVAWRYAPRELLAGLVLSGLGVLALVAIGFWALRRRARTGEELARTENEVSSA